MMMVEESDEDDEDIKRILSAPERVSLSTIVEN
jgi:hypothetical protein